MSSHGRRWVGVLAMGLALAAGPVGADDVWEINGEGQTDDNALTWNQLVHGVTQRHDFQGTGTNGTVADFDWMRVPTRVRRSYEVRTLGSPTAQDGGTCPNCAHLERVNAAGTVLQESDSPNGLISGSGGGNMSLRWFGTSSQLEYVRARGLNGFPTLSNDVYDVQFFDTTYFGPRFNQSGTQTTVIFVQYAGHSISSAAITGSVYFYGPTGNLLDSAALNVPVDGFQVIRTSEMPQLAGASGVVTIAHNGGYGALAAKAVALEPATGFSFDTLFTPIPR